MNVYIVSSNTIFAEAIEAALKMDAVGLYESASDVVGALTVREGLKARLLVLDFTTIPDAARLIDFLKSSASTKDVLVVATGDREQFAALHANTRDAIAGTLHLPFTAEQLAAVVAELREKHRGGSTT
jgi:hypothetical protein